MSNKKKIEISKIFEELSNTINNIGYSEEAIKDAILNKKFIRTRDGEEHLPVFLENKYVLSLGNDDKARKVPFYKIRDIFDNKVMNEQDNGTSMEYEALMALLNNQIPSGDVKKDPSYFSYEDFGREDEYKTLEKEVLIKWKYNNNLFETSFAVDIDIDYKSPTRIIPASMSGPAETVGDSASVRIVSADQEVIVNNLTNGEQFSDNINDELKSKINNYLKDMDGISYRN